MSQLEIIPLLEGKPFMTEFGIVGYSTVILLREEGKNILYDVGFKGCARQLKDALRENGLTADDITHIVLSHLHFDHTGNLGLFQKAKVLLSETEWNTACTNPDEWQCVLTCSYIREHMQMFFLKEGDLITSHVEVMELPGHTMGLLGLRCGEDVVLCSDALKNRYEMWENVPLMSVDLEKSRESIARIKREGHYIYPGHDSMLEINRPNNTEDIHFNIRFANGRIKEI